MDKYIGEIFVQRTLKQSRPGRHTPCRATKAIFWKIKYVSEDEGNLIRCVVENDKGDKYRGRFGDRTNNQSGMELRIIDHYENDYECYGSSGIAYNKDCFNFPLKDYHNAHDWMQEFHCKLGHPIPDGHWYDGNDPNESHDVPSEDDTPIAKRKRSDSLEPFPPTPKKAKTCTGSTVSTVSTVSTGSTVSTDSDDTDTDDEESCIDTCACKYCDKKDPTNYGYNSEGRYVYLSDEEEL